MAKFTFCTISSNSAEYGGGLAGGEILTDTIVAGNTNANGIASDIEGNATGSYNLIGTGGSGGVTGGSDGNIVLTSLTDSTWARWRITVGRPRPWPSFQAAPPSARATRPTIQTQPTRSRPTSAAHRSTHLPTSRLSNPTLNVTNATTGEDVHTTSGLVITPNAADVTTVTSFQITNIAGGSLFLNDGVTPVTNGEFISVAQGAAGLKFTPTTGSLATGSFTAEESTTGDTSGLIPASAATATIAVQRQPLRSRMRRPVRTPKPCRA